MIWVLSKIYLIPFLSVTSVTRTDYFSLFSGHHSVPISDGRPDMQFLQNSSQTHELPGKAGLGLLLGVFLAAAALLTLTGCGLSGSAVALPGGDALIGNVRAAINRLAVAYPALCNGDQRHWLSCSTVAQQFRRVRQQRKLPYPHRLSLSFPKLTDISGRRRREPGAFFGNRQSGARAHRDAWFL